MKFHTFLRFGLIPVAGLSNLRRESLQDINRLLLQYKHLLSMLLSCAKAFSGGLYKNFDPLVGENSCQIRGTYIAMIINYYQCKIFQTETIQRFDDVLQLIDNYSFGRSAYNVQSSTFESVLEQNNFEIELTSDETYIFQCFVLTETKSERLELKGSDGFHVMEIVTTDKLKKYGEHKVISSKYFHQLIKKMKQSVSKTSVDFLESQVKRLSVAHEIRCM
jgi:hypothetical protein